MFGNSLRSILLILLLPFLVAAVGAQEPKPYPDNAAPGNMEWLARTGDVWFLVVTITGEGAPPPGSTGHLLNVVVDQVLDYQTQAGSDPESGGWGFLEKVAQSSYTGRRHAVGDRLVTQWPQEKTVVAGDVLLCEKGDEIDADWPDFHDLETLGRVVQGYCPVCGELWDPESLEPVSEMTPGEPPPETTEAEDRVEMDARDARVQHYYECLEKGNDTAYCSDCGTPRTATVTATDTAPPTGKWIIGVGVTRADAGPGEVLPVILRWRDSPEAQRRLVSELDAWARPDYNERPDWWDNQQ